MGVDSRENEIIKAEGALTESDLSSCAIGFGPYSIGSHWRDCYAHSEDYTDFLATSMYLQAVSEKYSFNLKQSAT